MRSILIMAACLLFGGSFASPAGAAAILPGDHCGAGPTALKHNVGVVNPGQSVWYRPEIVLPGDQEQGRNNILGVMWWLLSEDADLYLYTWDCSEVQCQSTNPYLALDGCDETDCCGVGGYEIRYKASPGYAPGAPVAFELRWCYSYTWSCVPA